MLDRPQTATRTRADIGRVNPRTMHRRVAPLTQQPDVSRRVVRVVPVDVVTLHVLGRTAALARSHPADLNA
jgi:hypothetical protein